MTCGVQQISGGYIQCWNYDSGYDMQLVTSAAYRDPSAWYHIVFAVDTTQAVAANRAKLYVNGSRVTAFSTETYPDQNLDTKWNEAVPHFIGSKDGTRDYFDGYLADLYTIDGTAYDADDFGETDEDSGIWKPKEADVTFGSNGGVFLEFKQSGTGTDASGMGADTSGNTNHMAVNNLAATSQATDTPTNNFCTMNPLANAMGGTLSEGNLKLVEPGAVDKHCFSTFGLTSGKWYFECKVTDQGARGEVGFTDTDHGVTSSGTNYALINLWNGTVDGGSATENSNVGSGFSDNDILCVAMDLDNGQVWFSEDANIDITGTANITGLATSGLDRDYRINSRATGSPATTYEYNFGNPSFSISSGNADANGYGNFEYAVPSGYYALCTKNLAEYG